MTAKNKILLGICGALAAGVVIGLLVAPEKGSDMRKKIRQTAGDWADGLAGLWTKGKDAAENLSRKAKSAASSVADEV